MNEHKRLGISIYIGVTPRGFIITWFCAAGTKTLNRNGRLSKIPSL